MSTPKMGVGALSKSRRNLACKLVLAGVALSEAEYGCIRVQRSRTNEESRPGIAEPRPPAPEALGIYDVIV